MSSFHLPALSYIPSTSGGGPMPNTHPPDSKQQDLQGAGHTATAGTLPSEAQASGKVSKASAQPVEQSLSARRAKSVFSVMERLLEETVADPQHLQNLVRPLSGEEYLQVAEERHLAGMCGHAACPNEMRHATGKHRLQQQNETGFCSSSCELAARRLASRLGPADSAMDRFAAGSEKPARPETQKKPVSTYAAGAADNPIMLAQVKEKDAAALQAEAQMRAALARDTSAALAAGSESHAVEGYVPRNSPGIAATVAPRAVVPVDSAKSDSNMSQGPPLDAAPSSEQGSSTAGSVEQHNIPAEASPPAGHNTSQRSAAAAGKPEAKTNATQSFVNGIQDVSASSGSSSQASSLSADAQTPAQDRRRVAEDDKELDRCGATVSARERPQQPAKGMERSALASSNAQSATEAEHIAAEGVASASADPAQQPVLVFEVEDPEGPLDTPSEDIGQQFGRLQLKTAAELGLPAHQLSELAAVQGDTPQPTLEQDLQLWKQHVGIQQGNGDKADSVAAVASEVQERVLPDFTPAAELPEDDATSEAELESDDESALQWLSEAPADFGRHLSGFGQLFTLLEGLVTTRSSKLLQGGEHADSTELPAHSSLQGQAVLEGAVERVLGDVLKAMHVPALRSPVEQHLHRLAGTLHFAAAIPNLQGADWQMLTVVMLKALSQVQLPALQDSFDSRAGVQTLDAYVSSIGYSMEELWSLLDLLLE